MYKSKVCMIWYKECLKKIENEQKKISKSIYMVACKGKSDLEFKGNLISKKNF